MIFVPKNEFAENQKKNNFNQPPSFGTALALSRNHLLLYSVRISKGVFMKKELNLSSIFKILSLVLGWFVVGILNPARAGAQVSSDSLNSEWFMGFGLGADIPAYNWQSAYPVGGGGEFSFGYDFNRVLALELDVDDFYFSGTNYAGSVSDDELRLLPTFRLRLSSGPVRPYLTAGAGVDVQFQAPPHGNLTQGYFDAAFGLGMEFQVDPSVSLFLEGKYNLIFTNQVTGSDIPVLGGLRFDLSDEPAAPVTVIEKSEPVTVTVQAQTLPATKEVVYILEDQSNGSNMTGFKTGHYQFILSPNDLAAVHDIKQTLDADPNKRLVLKGYTDSVGTWNENQQLSVDRAEWVEALLINYGIPREKIQSYSGGSEADPIATNETQAGRAQNRRVMIKIITINPAAQ
jgi:outer membrane protein OmpA-like peptidoglycan-associated protein